ncbi:Lytic transglycosylase catalytic [Alicycliphilus sp. B1]|nr:Lytic transglycosylase catalytic [Alicycliphilus sp. B1]
MIDLPPDLAQCAPQVSPVLMQALVRTESAWNPYAIGPDAGQRAIAQPQTLDEAVKTVKQLQAMGAKFSVGLAQIHISNVTSRGITWEQAFNPCSNLRIGQTILFEYYGKAIKEGYSGVDAVWAALRGYNSGGVNRTVSDKYAEKIFTYMRAQQASAGAPKAARSTPASTDPRFTQLARSVQIETPGANTPPALAITSNPNSVRDGESPDIFQAQEGTKGF